MAILQRCQEPQNPDEALPSSEERMRRQSQEVVRLKEELKSFKKATNLKFEEEEKKIDVTNDMIVEVKAQGEQNQADIERLGSAHKTEIDGLRSEFNRQQQTLGLFETKIYKFCTEFVTMVSNNIKALQNNVTLLETALRELHAYEQAIVNSLQNNETGIQALWTKLREVPTMFNDIKAKISQNTADLEQQLLDLEPMFTELLKNALVEYEKEKLRVQLGYGSEEEEQQQGEKMKEVKEKKENTGHRYPLGLGAFSHRGVLSIYLAAREPTLKWRLREEDSYHKDGLLAVKSSYIKTAIIL